MRKVLILLAGLLMFVGGVWADDKEIKLLCNCLNFTIKLTTPPVFFETCSEAGIEENMSVYIKYEEIKGINRNYGHPAGEIFINSPIFGDGSYYFEKDQKFPIATLMEEGEIFNDFRIGPKEYSFLHMGPIYSEGKFAGIQSSQFNIDRVSLRAYLKSFPVKALYEYQCEVVEGI
jgi:hypothetical protein